MDLDLGTSLGATGQTSVQRLTLYLPNKDKHGQVLADHQRWVDEARGLLTLIGGGATALPAAEGSWLDENGTTLWEETKTIYCFILPDRFRARLTELRSFLHRFGRQTNQGEVVVEFDGQFYRINEFDQSLES